MTSNNLQCEMDLHAEANSQIWILKLKIKLVFSE